MMKVYDLKLVWFKNDCKRNVRLSVNVFSDNTFTMTATTVMLASAISPSGEMENWIIPRQQQISGDILQKMQTPKSRFLSNQCDLVIFENSPIYQARYSN
jgi:hypothetical protein